jgi:hypothetical protein
MLPSPIATPNPRRHRSNPFHSHATHGRPQAALLLGGRGQPPLLRLREGFSDDEKGEEASAERGTEGEGGRWLPWLERAGRS